jgi:hypothetical protein
MIAAKNEEVVDRVWPLRNKWVDEDIPASYQAGNEKISYQRKTMIQNSMEGVRKIL